MTRLPLLARALLRLTDPHVREFVSGDLEESIGRGLDADVPVYPMRAFKQAMDEDRSSSRICGSIFVAFAHLAMGATALPCRVLHPTR